MTALDRLPKLVDITLRNNPVAAVEKPETTRELIIARIGKLQVPGETRHVVSATSERAVTAGANQTHGA